MITRLGRWFGRYWYEPEVKAPIPPRTISERLDDLATSGYRPRIKTHIIRPNEVTKDEMIEQGWLVLPTGDVYGWVVDATPVDGSQSILGGTMATLEGALVDAEIQLDQLRESRKRR